VLTVAPWNYPYLTAVNSVVPALMAGNAVLLKHAAQTLLVGDRFVDGALTVEDAEGLLAQRFDGEPETAYLIRPDQHVCARWRSPNAPAIRGAGLRALALLS